MGIKESTKITLTIGQLRKLIREATVNETPDQEPVTKMDGGIVRLGPCNHQRALCWKLNGFCFAPADINPSLSKHLPYIMLCQKDTIWQMHFENFATFDSKSYLDALYKAFAKTCEEEGIKEIGAVGGCTPGGLSGITALQNYGFKKVYQPTLDTKKEFEDSDGSNIYWGGDTIDTAKADKWLNGGKHMDEFLVIDNPDAESEEQTISTPKAGEKYTLQNTMPRPFHMVR